MTSFQSLLPGGLASLRWWHLVNGLLFAYYRLIYYGRVDVMTEDWDNLIILDACRADVFAERCELEGKFRTRISRGTATGEFLTENIGDRSFLTLYT